MLRDHLGELLTVLWTLGHSCKSEHLQGRPYFLELLRYDLPFNPLLLPGDEPLVPLSCVINIHPNTFQSDSYQTNMNFPKFEATTQGCCHLAEGAARFIPVTQCGKSKLLSLNFPSLHFCMFPHSANQTAEGHSWPAFGSPSLKRLVASLKKQSNYIQFEFFTAKLYKTRRWDLFVSASSRENIFSDWSEKFASRIQHTAYQHHIRFNKKQTQNRYLNKIIDDKALLITIRST